MLCKLGCTGMQDHQAKDFMDTVQLVDGTDAPSAVKTGTSAADFDNASHPGDLWPEAADAQCSEHAALFAGTQPAPLTVV